VWKSCVTAIASKLADVAGAPDKANGARVRQPREIDRDLTVPRQQAGLALP